MKISIITVTYNSERTIEQTIQSVLSQDYPNIEYIIIDGLSSDQTLSLIKKYESKISRLISEKDHGIYDALNKGINLATGDIVAILHSDDFYAHNRVISKYVDVFTQSAADAVYADLNYVDAQNTHRVVRKWVSGIYQPHLFYEGWMPPHPTFLIKTNILKQKGLYNTSFKTAADYELMLRMILGHQISLAYLNEVTVLMRTGGQSNVSIKNRIQANIEDRKAWKINGLKPKWYTLFKKPLGKIFQFFK